MRAIMGVTLAVVGLFFTGSGSAEPASAESRPQAFPPFSVPDSALRQQCWLEHTQVQPAPLPSAAVEGNLAVGGPKVWNPPGGRPGAEHWNIADLQRACRSQLTRRFTVSGPTADFLSAP